MNSEAINISAVAGKATAMAKGSVGHEDFQEFGTLEITGNFKGFWRDVPQRDEHGNIREEPVTEVVTDDAGNPKLDEYGNIVRKPVIDENGNPKMRKIIHRRFKISRSVKRKADGATVKHSAWLEEPTATKCGLQEGVSYLLTISASESLTPDKNNGRQEFVDEYFYNGDVSVVSVNGVVVK